MSASDIVGCSLFSSFGLWWFVAPKSVIRFYTWFHRGQIAKLAKAGKYIGEPAPAMIRVLGLIWIVLVLGITLFQAPQ
ncbi:MAG: hypothetical protein ABSC48_06385 [Terracidiphilus sp.]|jgi:hypothetical protein